LKIAVVHGIHNSDRVREMPSSEEYNKIRRCYNKNKEVLSYLFFEDSCYSRSRLVSIKELIAEYMVITYVNPIIQNVIILYGSNSTLSRSYTKYSKEDIEEIPDRHTLDLVKKYYDRFSQPLLYLQAEYYPTPNIITVKELMRELLSQSIIF